MNTEQGQIEQTEWAEEKVEFLPTLNLANKEGKPGAFFIGDYVSSRAIDGEFNGEETEYKLHTFKIYVSNVSANKSGNVEAIGFGEAVEVWGAGQLNYLVSRLKEGDRVKMEYLGKVSVQGFANPIHQFRMSRPKLASAPNEAAGVPY